MKEIKKDIIDLIVGIVMIIVITITIATVVSCALKIKKTQEISIELKKK